MTHNFTNELHTLRGFVKLKKISKVGGWIKPQLGFFFVEMLLYVLFFVAVHVFKKT